MKKPLNKIKSDKDIEKFLNKDLSDYLNKDNFKAVTFEFAPKDKSINLRLSSDLLNTIKDISKIHGISYQKYIRQALEKTIKLEFIKG
jgi:predicted DNA binding CopG/RHH family protein